MPKKKKKVAVLKPCPRCLALARAGEIRAETVMPLHGGVMDALSRFDPKMHLCWDCASAESLPGLDASEERAFIANRTALGNGRQEQLRLPEGLRPNVGLCKAGLQRPSVGKNALEDHQAWLDEAVPDWFEWTR